MVARLGSQHAPQILKPRGWRQPVGPQMVDRTHPLARGLLACYLPTPWHGLTNLVGTGNDLTLQPSGGYSVTGSGVGVSGTAASMGSSAVANAAVQITGECSLFWAGTFTGTPGTSNSTLMGVSATNNDTAPFDAWEMVVNGGKPNYIYMQYNNAGSNASWVWTTARVVADYGRPVNYLLTCSAAALNLYYNGIDQGAGVTNGGSAYAGTQTYTTPLVQFGAYIAQPTRYIGGHSAFGLFYNRKLTPQESIWLSMEPYAMLSPARAMLGARPLVIPGSTLLFAQTVM